MWKKIPPRWDRVYIYLETRCGCSSKFATTVEKSKFYQMNGIDIALKCPHINAYRAEGLEEPRRANEDDESRKFCFHEDVSGHPNSDAVRDLIFREV